MQGKNKMICLPETFKTLASSIGMINDENRRASTVLHGDGAVDANSGHRDVFDLFRIHWRTINICSIGVAAVSAAFLLRRLALRRQIRSVEQIVSDDFQCRRVIPVKIFHDIVRHDQKVFAQVWHSPRLVPNFLLDTSPRARIWVRLFGGCSSGPDGVIDALADEKTLQLINNTKGFLEMLFLHSTDNSIAQKPGSPTEGIVGHLLFQDESVSRYAQWRYGRSKLRNYCVHFVKTGKLQVLENEGTGKLASTNLTHMREMNKFLDNLITAENIRKKSENTHDN